MAANNDLTKDVWAKFKDTQNVFLSTADDDQPRVRPVTLIHFEKHLWIMTGTDDAKIKQIKKNPKIELCLLIKKEKVIGYIRLAGTAEIITEKELKTKLAQHVNFFKEYWEGVEDPNYTLLKINPEEIEYLPPGEFSVQKLKP